MESHGTNCGPNDQSHIIDRCQLFNSLLRDFHLLAEEILSKISLNNAFNNPTTITAEDTKALPNPKTASQADANASSHTAKSTDELPAAIATAFEKLDLAAHESEEEGGFEMMDEDEAMEDDDDMVVVEATEEEEEEEEEDYVEV